jgi:RES domain
LSLALPHNDDPEVKHICFACVGEEFLRAEIEKEGEPATCSYCGKNCNSLSMEELADRIEAVFEEHYRRTSTEPSSLENLMIKEGDFDWDRKGEPVVWAIADAAEIEEGPASDVQEILADRHADFDSAAMGEECEFEADAHYAEKGPNDIEFREQWRFFELSLKTETRFFNPYAQTTLRAVFEGLADHETRDGRRVIRQAGPGFELAALYRARVFQSSDPLERALVRPDIGIGPPPYHSAAPGRMNAQGISVFYATTDPDVALAEIRPPVGSRVLIGKFELLRPMRLLDVAALESVFVKGSIFDGGFMRRLERARFLQHLSRRITMPVMPNDETSDYLITQAIADYLATEVKLDGILYPSAQARGRDHNVVLFHGAARVKRLELPPNTEISTQLYESTEDGPEIDYRVWEEVYPPTEPSEEPVDSFPPNFDRLSEIGWIDRDQDVREPTLKLDLPSLQVRHISAVTFTTKDYMVHRHRLERRERPRHRTQK